MDGQSILLGKIYRWNQMNTYTYMYTYGCQIGGKYNLGYNLDPILIYIYMVTISLSAILHKWTSWGAEIWSNNLSIKRSDNRYLLQ